jgi:large subunit ribosomal protein L4
MSKQLLNTNGEALGEITLAKEVFGVEPNLHVMHLALRRQLNNARQGSACAKTRAEVSGGGKKPWKQKGTGRARAGSLRSPLFVGGGVIFGPNPRSFTYTVPKKVRRLALKSALSSKFADSKMIVVEDMNLSEVKTAAVAKALKDLGAGASSLVVLEGANKNAELSARNIKDVKTAYVNTINVFDILKYDSFIATKAAVEKIEEVYK